jgi:hypothetical protein
VPVYGLSIFALSGCASGWLPFFRAYLLRSCRLRASSCRASFGPPNWNLSAVPGVFVSMTPTLINALHAAETLAAHHRRLANNSTGATREYHLDAAERCLVESENIRRQIAADGGVAPENQAAAVHQRDLAIAQALIARHVLPEWLTSEQAPRLLGTLAQDIADAIGAARGDGARP